jgi:hypothetical protein
MKDIPLPDTWTGWRSAAALMILTGHASGLPLSPAQKRLIFWELEKYGPCYCELPAEELAADALRLVAEQLSSDTEPDPCAYGRFHASVVLARRGREALNLTLAACARVNNVGPRADDEATHRFLYDAWINAIGQATLHVDGQDHHLGADEAQDYADFGVLQPLPTFSQAVACLRATTAILPLQPGWTRADGFAFLIHASHVADRPEPRPLPPSAREIIERLAPMFGHTGTIDDLLARARALYQRCEDHRFVILRVVEDQLMHFVSLSLDERKLILRIVNSFASDDLTALRRAIVTSTMAVLATSERAQQRARFCSAWPL